jgi:hypothetical protein
VCHLKRNSNFNSICKLIGDINIIVLLNTSLSGYALLNATRTVPNNFYAKMEHSSASGRAPAGLLRIWWQQKPSNQGDTDCSVRRKVERVPLSWENTLWFNFCTIMCDCCLGFILNGTSCIQELPVKKVMLSLYQTVEGHRAETSRLPHFPDYRPHKWRWDYQSYAPAAIYPQEDSWYSFLLETESIHGP